MEMPAGSPTVPADLPLNNAPQSAVPPTPTTSFVPGWIPWVVIGCVPVICFFGLLTFGPMESWFFFRQQMIQRLASAEYVVVKNQPLTGEGIVVSYARLKKPGYVTAKFVDKFNSPSDHTLGETEPLPAG